MADSTTQGATKITRKAMAGTRQPARKNGQEKDSRKNTHERKPPTPRSSTYLISWLDPLPCSYMSLTPLCNSAACVTAFVVWMLHGRAQDAVREGCREDTEYL
ncbi:uncharacterized protein BDW43DRAFT_289546, partial [Aspergillus alliaceus]|uniref:uncharacterized protein n=1 Tax=Petromyces alliaceus TaxID=209559 RepID=UPI0012A758A8